MHREKRICESEDTRDTSSIEYLCYTQPFRLLALLRVLLARQNSYTPVITYAA